MSTGSSNGRRESTSLRFCNLQCRCGLRAAVLISDSVANPHRLYYRCPKWSPKSDDHCGFFRWCEPIDADPTTGSRMEAPTEHLNDIITVLMQMQTEMRNTNIKMQRMEKLNRKVMVISHALLVVLTIKLFWSFV